MLEVTSLFVESFFCGAENYGINGSMTEGGGAHIFYGNIMDIEPGTYLATAYVDNPRDMASPEMMIEALGWTDFGTNRSQPETLKSYSFSVTGNAEKMVIVLPFVATERISLEVRCWAEAHATDLHFRGVMLQRVASILPRDVGEAKAWMQGGQVFCLDAAPTDPMFITALAANGAPLHVFTVFGPPGQPVMDVNGRALWTAALPASLVDPAAAMVMSTNGQSYLLVAVPGTRALASQPVSAGTALPASAAPAISTQAGDGLPEELIGTLGRLVRFREEAGAQIAALESHVHGPVSSALTDVDSWRRQMPTLFNALSAANSAAGVVAKLRADAEQREGQFQTELGEIRKEISALWEVFKHT